MIGVVLGSLSSGVPGGLLIRRLISSTASIRFIGRRNTMFALFDSGNERVLMLLGEPESSLSDYLPQLLTVGQTRIDLIISSHQLLTSDSTRAAVDLKTTPAISLQAHASVAPISGNVTPVTDLSHIQLGANSKLIIEVHGSRSTSGENGEDPTDPNITIHLRSEGVEILLANRDSSLRSDIRGIHLLAVPGDIDVSSIRSVSPSLFLGTSLHEDLGIPERLIFHNDPTKLTVKDGALHLHDDQFSS